MFIGHLALALGAKRIAPKVSLGWLVAATLFIDLIWPPLLLLGWERVVIAPGITAVTPLDFVHYPISHSLVAVCREQACARADGVPNQNDAARVYPWLRAKPSQAGRDVLGKVRHRGEGGVIAAPVCASVQQQRVHAGLDERSRERRHVERASSPAVHDQRGRAALI